MLYDLLTGRPVFRGIWCPGPPPVKVCGTSDQRKTGAADLFLQPVTGVL